MIELTARSQSKIKIKHIEIKTGNQTRKMVDCSLKGNHSTSLWVDIFPYSKEFVWVEDLTYIFNSQCELLFIFLNLAEVVESLVSQCCKDGASDQ